MAPEEYPKFKLNMIGFPLFHTYRPYYEKYNRKPTLLYPGFNCPQQQPPWDMNHMYPQPYYPANPYPPPYAPYDNPYITPYIQHPTTLPPPTPHHPPRAPTPDPDATPRAPPRTWLPAHAEGHKPTHPRLPTPPRPRPSPEPDSDQRSLYAGASRRSDGSLLPASRDSYAGDSEGGSVVTNGTRGTNNLGLHCLSGAEGRDGREYDRDVRRRMREARIAGATWAEMYEERERERWNRWGTR